MKYFIIGNGVAGTTAAETIRKSDKKGEIIIHTEEKTPFYSRIRLIEYLAGEAREEDIIIHGSEWHEKNHIQLCLDSRISNINTDNNEVVIDKGEICTYDRLLLATGGISFIPPIKGANKKGVFALRTIEDANDIIRYSEDKKNIVLIGGGVLGLEAGNSMRKRGHETSVVEFFPRLLPRQMDAEGANILKSQMESMGFRFYLGAKTKEITGDKHADGVLLEDGTRINGDVIIISAGVRPRSELAKTLGLTIKKGVLVNDKMETEKKNIYAAGDLIEHRENFYGIWPAAQRQGEVAGINMAGGNAIYEGTTMSNLLKVVGIDLAAAGDIDADNKYESIVIKDRDKFHYRKLVIKESTLSGCILYGDTSGYNSILNAIEKKKDIHNIRERLEKWDLNALK